MLEIDLNPADYPAIFAFVQDKNQPLTLFDLETTGLTGAANFGITEIATVTFYPDGEIQAVSELVNPQHKIYQDVMELTGITNEMVRGKPHWGEKWAHRLETMAVEHVFAGFNSNRFDCPAILSQNMRYGRPGLQFQAAFDVMLFYRAITGEKSGKLGELCELYGVKARGRAHRALADTVMTVDLLEALLQKHGTAALTDKKIWYANKVTDWMTRTPVIAGTAALDAKLAQANEAERLLDVLSKDLKIFGWSQVPEVASRLEVSKLEASRLIGTAIDRNAIDTAYVVHPATQDWLEGVLPEAIAATWHSTSVGELKPLFQYLKDADVPAGLMLDYVQLRIGLDLLGESWRLRDKELLAA